MTIKLGHEPELIHQYGLMATRGTHVGGDRGDTTSEKEIVPCTSTVGVQLAHVRLR